MRRFFSRPLATHATNRAVIRSLLMVVDAAGQLLGIVAQADVGLDMAV